jgi:chromosome transmission fidelity protein 8
MTQIPIHRSASERLAVAKNPLPTLLQTPSGLALLELQGTINLPAHSDDSTTTRMEGEGGMVKETPIGRLVFPDWVEGMEGMGWMKKVYLYVGRHQRMTGEVKKLPKAVAVIRRRDTGKGRDEEDEDAELEIVELVKYKILFATRPEPVGTWAAED